MGLVGPVAGDKVIIVLVCGDLILPKSGKNCLGLCEVGGVLPCLMCKNKCKSDVLVGISGIGRVCNFATLPFPGKKILLIFEVVICPIQKTVKGWLILKVDGLEECIGHTFGGGEISLLWVNDAIFDDEVIFVRVPGLVEDLIKLSYTGLARIDRWGGICKVVWER